MSWTALRDRVAAALASLPDGEFLVVGEPEGPREPARGLLRRRPEPPPRRYVQFLRLEDGVSAECVGATSFGGDYEITPAQHEQLRALGWKAPGDTGKAEEASWGYPNYRLESRAEDAAALAQLAVDSLVVLGLAADSSIDVSGSVDSPGE